MATSKCLGCGATRFELKLTTPHGSAYKLYFVQCASCGGVVGVQEFNNVTAMLAQQNEAIQEIGKKLGATIRL